MTSSERAKLRGIAMNLQPSTHIGKNGLNETLIAQIEEQLEAHELIKIAVLNNAEFSAKDVIEELSSLCKAEPVQAMGSKITLYRRSSKKDIKHLL